MYIANVDIILNKRFESVENNFENCYNIVNGE